MHMNEGDSLFPFYPFIATIVCLTFIIVVGDAPTSLTPLMFSCVCPFVACFFHQPRHRNILDILTKERE